MKTRIISALIMLPLAIFVYLGGVPLLIFEMILAAMALHEFYKGFTALDYHVDEWIGYVSVLCLHIIIVWGEFFQHEYKTYAHLLLLWVFGTVAAGLLTFIFKKGLKIEEGIIMILGCLYIGFFFAHIPLITRIEMYKNLVWIVFLSALGSDIFAYFGGYFFGKNKLAPEISPKKTVEGSIAGILGGALLCGLFAKLVYPDLVLHCLIIGLFAAAFSQTGDLIASAFKRRMGIKDYGNLIPGHGGILDRFDSVLITAPFVYYYILIILRP